MPSSIYSENNYIEYQPGTSNVILTIPHGGNMRPSHIPNRDAGSLNDRGEVVYNHDPGTNKDYDKFPARIKRDMYTQELGLLLADRLEQLTSQRPHVVICHLYRGKLDANRAMNEASFGVPEMEWAWHEFHRFIGEAKASIEQIHRRGLLLDIHGQTHKEDWVELGYTISSKQLNEGSFHGKPNSIQGLLTANRLTSARQISEAIQGESSFGGMIRRRGFKVIPSPQHPCPNGGGYYTGAYNVWCHGSRNGGPIDAILVESPRSLRTAKALPPYAEALASSIVEYMQLYYQVKR